MYPQDGTVECLGRFLIKVPTSGTFRTKTQFRIYDLTTSFVESKDEFLKSVDKKASVLENTPHEEGGKMLVRRINLGNEATLLISWEQSDVKSSHRSQYFYYLGSSYSMLASGVTSSKRPEAVEMFFRDWFSSRVKYRNPTEIPAEAGFCFDHAFISDSSMANEHVTASLRFPAPYEYVTVSISASTTGNPSEPLLDRAPAAIRMFGNALAGMSTLRAKSRTVDQMPGQEYLIRADAEGKKSYNFTWQYPGKANSLSDQNVSIDLSTSENRDSRGEVVTAPFANDNEALAFWDQLLSGFRLRPGATGSVK